jgi:O-methyltransferase
MKRIIRRFYSSIVPYFASRVIRDVLADSLTFLDLTALSDLHRMVRSCERNKLEGVLIEAGCAAGGSAIVMTSAKRPSRQIFVYDVFGMIPEPSEKDGADVLDRYKVIKQGDAKGIGDREYYGYESDLMTKVENNFSKHGYPTAKNNVMLVKGLFSDTITGSEPVALAHLDGDWYSSVKVCLERIVPRLVVGGTLVIDDYDAWSGCRKAVDEYFADKKKNFAFVKKSRLSIVRIRS